MIECTLFLTSQATAATTGINNNPPMLSNNHNKNSPQVNAKAHKVLSCAKPFHEVQQETLVLCDKPTPESLYPPNKIIFTRAEGSEDDGCSTFYICKLSADAPVFQADDTGEKELDGATYHLIKGEYYLNGVWYEELEGDKNRYVLSKYGSTNRPWKCIVTLSSVLHIDPNVGNKSATVYNLPDKIHGRLVKQCHEMDEQEKREKKVRHVHIICEECIISFSLSSQICHTYRYRLWWSKRSV